VGIRGCFTRGEVVGYWGDHSLPSNSKVKNAWSYTSTFPYFVMILFFMKHGSSFAFLIIFIYWVNLGTTRLSVWQGQDKLLGFRVCMYAHRGGYVLCPCAYVWIFA
jgi:hypothetical protein